MHVLAALCDSIILELFPPEICADKEMCC